MTLIAPLAGPGPHGPSPPNPVVQPLLTKSSTVPFALVRLYIPNNLLYGFLDLSETGFPFWLCFIYLLFLFVCVVYEKEIENACACVMLVWYIEDQASHCLPSQWCNTCITCRAMYYLYPNCKCLRNGDHHGSDENNDKEKYSTTRPTLKEGFPTLPCCAAVPVLNGMPPGGVWNSCSDTPEIERHVPVSVSVCSGNGSVRPSVVARGWGPIDEEGGMLLVASWTGLGWLCLAVCAGRSWSLLLHLPPRPSLPPYRPSTKRVGMPRARPTKYPSTLLPPSLTHPAALPCSCSCSPSLHSVFFLLDVDQGVLRLACLRVVELVLFT